jgi:hypothetical protein
MKLTLSSEDHGVFVFNPSRTVGLRPCRAAKHAGQDDKECIDLNVTCSKDVKRLPPVFLPDTGGPEVEPNRPDQRRVPFIVCRTQFNVG